jgi:hypothetical protein
VCQLEIRYVYRLSDEREEELSKLESRLEASLEEIMFGGGGANPFFAALFGSGGGMPFQQPPPPTQPTIPPASRNFLAALKDIPVTADDILEVNNRECLVCLEDHAVGGLAVKLPCGHLFHRACVCDWLKRHCTCPCCRFEVESDDAEYEKDRRMRMKGRKLRMRADEISGKTLGQLRELCRQTSTSIVGCIDKTEIVDRLINSGRIEVTEQAPAVEILRSVFMSKGVGDLRHLLKSFGISDEGALEKKELRGRLEESGRVIIVEDGDGAAGPADSMSGYSTLVGEGAASLAEQSSSKDGAMDVDPDTHEAHKPESEQEHPPTQPQQQSPSAAVFKLELQLLSSLPIREVKSIISSYGLDASKCLERGDLIQLLRQDSRFEIIE